MAATWVGTVEGDLICLGSTKRQSIGRLQLPAPIRAVSVSSDGSRIGVACGDSVYEAAPIVEPSPAAEAAMDAIGSPLAVLAAESTTFVLARRENTVDLWRIEDYGWESVWRRPGVIDAGVTPDGQLLYLATAEGRLEQILLSAVTHARPLVREIHQDRGRWRNGTIMLGWEGVAICAQDEDQQQRLFVYGHTGSLLASFIFPEFPVLAPQDGVVVGTRDVLFPTPAGNIVDIDLGSGRMAQVRAVREPMFGSFAAPIGGLLTIPSQQDLLCWTEDGWIKRMMPPRLDVTQQRHLDVNGHIVFCSRIDGQAVICVDSGGMLQRYNLLLGRIEAFTWIRGGPIRGASLDVKAGRLVVWTADGVITLVDAEEFRELAMWICPNGVNAVVNSYARSVTRVAFTDSRGALGVLIAGAERKES